MQIPISGITQSFGFLVFFFLALRFLKYSQKEKDIIGRFFGYAFFLASLSRIFFAVPCLFFLKDHTTWVIFEIIQRTFLVASLVFLGYIIFLVGLEKYAKKITFFLAFIALIVVIGFALSPPIYNIGGDGILAWQDPPFWPSLLNFFLMILVLVPGIIIFLKEARVSNIRIVKIRSLGFFGASILILIISLLDFFIILLLGLGAIYSEISYIVFYVFLALTLVLAYFPSQKKQD